MPFTSERPRRELKQRLCCSFCCSNIPGSPGTGWSLSHQLSVKEIPLRLAQRRPVGCSSPQVTKETEAREVGIKPRSPRWLEKPSSCLLAEF